MAVAIVLGILAALILAGLVRALFRGGLGGCLAIVVLVVLGLVVASLAGIIR